MNKKWFVSLSLAAVVSITAACNGVNNGNEGEGNNLDGDPAGNNEEAMGEIEMEMPEPDLDGVPDVVAEVNGQEILKEDFEATYVGQFQQMAMQGQMTGEEVDQSALKQRVIENMVGTELLDQEANSSDFDVTENDIAAKLDEIASHNGMDSAEEFLMAVEAQGMNEEDVMAEIETQVKIDQLIVREAGEIQVTEEELQAFYDDLLAQQEQMMAGEDTDELDIPTFEEIRPNLEAELVSQQENEVLQTIVANLRESGDVVIHL
ncbi:SurA N-terminal domain-containing protein [Evansella sp. AB-P1]|uniref:SurA N-terminal domain-containing protein n=1 Tax=Evansella sp. AB-P1 TaxID=3037653 RepID=UPI00241E3C78|nr:SurA N-terminal domain-containing protein [Evansella sp. AB-P1]MDG5789341.1 SurA N-terminal domain-containing protein [Evansella sp. AB-P1]